MRIKGTEAVGIHCGCTGGNCLLSTEAIQVNFVSLQLSYRALSSYTRESILK